ncbi:cleavage stimulation factor subunit 77 isoform X1 [Senna tora]|uniref:Cleavage stimulation factor subunit 77 isoform X1 n=1 Tax=Senna tora TaxID=362788 RepID=A0A834TDF1_9FABA|nr:cleavage stimulation factor subunit 77 isoform X1 [Senna tora]
MKLRNYRTAQKKRRHDVFSRSETDCESEKDEASHWINNKFPPSRIRFDPQVQIPGSSILIFMARLHLPIAEATPIYEQLLTLFPTAAKFWRQYVEAHMAVNNDDATKQIFSRCLLICLQIPLWRCYIRFIRKANDKKGVEGQEETRKAFDFMLNYVGSDIASGPVWMEYISFLKSLPAQNTQEESQRMTAVRKVYQKAIVTPMHHIEQLWKEYENFENSVSRQLAKGLISEYQPKYTSARAVYRERKKYVDEIDWNMLAVPPTGSEEIQWMAWKRLLAFENFGHACHLMDRIDTASSNKRVIFTYEQCLMYLYHYPDIWYDYATWHAKGGSIDAAIKVFQRSLKALPESEMLRYAYAELEESRGAIQVLLVLHAAKKIYESLLGDGVSTTALAHIQLLRMSRKAHCIQSARKYFLDALKSSNCTYHVYIAYAMMAFCLDKDPKMAHNVFEAGLKRFMHEPVYILEYADFLTRLNDDQNIRALFERALSSLPPDESVEVWKKFAQFEQTYGDLASMLKVEQRRKEALSGSGPTPNVDILCYYYSYLGILFILEVDTIFLIDPLPHKYHHHLLKFTEQQHKSFSFQHHEMSSFVMNQSENLVEEVMKSHSTLQNTMNQSSVFSAVEESHCVIKVVIFGILFIIFVGEIPVRNREELGVSASMVQVQF